MSSKKFFLVAAMVLIIVLMAVNFNEVKAAAAKLTGGALPGGTDVSGNGGSTSTPATVTKGGGTSVKVANDYNMVLKKGVSGPEVAELQYLLNKVNAIKRSITVKIGGQISYVIEQDGKFGPHTESFLKHFSGVTSITLNQAYERIRAAYGV